MHCARSPRPCSPARSRPRASTRIASRSTCCRSPGACRATTATPTRSSSSSTSRARSSSCPTCASVRPACACRSSRRIPRPCGCARASRSRRTRRAPCWPPPTASRCSTTRPRTSTPWPSRRRARRACSWTHPPRSRRPQRARAVGRGRQPAQGRRVQRRGHRRAARARQPAPLRRLGDAGRGGRRRPGRPGLRGRPRARGRDVTVFEARDRVGGRVWSGVMPDGARFERGGEFIETGYDDVPPPRGRVRPAARATGVRVRRSRGAIRGRTQPTLLLQAERELAATVDALGTDAAAATTAAEALARTPLEPLARRALRRRLEGTSRWGSTACRRPGSRAPSSGGRHSRGFRTPGRRQRRPGEGDGLGAGRARAARLCTLQHDARRAPSGRGLRSRRAGSPASGRHRPAAPVLRERGSYGRLQWGVAAKLHVPLAEPAAPRAVQGARGRVLDVDGRRGRRRSPPRSQAASTRSSRSRSGSAPSAGAPPSGGCGPSWRCSAKRCSRAGGTTIPGAAAPMPAIRRGGRSATTRPSQRRSAASTWRASTPRRSSAERWKVRSGAAPGRRPRCSQRRLSERLTYV